MALQRNYTTIPFALINSLPPLVAVLVWEVYVRKVVDLSTINLAQKASDEEYHTYDLVRCLTAGNPDYPPVETSYWLVVDMLEKLEVPRGTPA